MGYPVRSHSPKPCRCTLTVLEQPCALQGDPGRDPRGSCIWTGYLGSKAANGGSKWQEGAQMMMEKGGGKLAFLI